MGPNGAADVIIITIAMKLAISIINWNTGQLLANCLRSLLALPDAERSRIDSVWIIDNASRDQSVEQARAVMAASSESLPIHLIVNKNNVGFAAGNNQALQKIGGGRQVLLLNPDTEVEPGALSALLAVLESDSTVGIVGPRLVNSDGSLQGSVRPFPKFGDFILYMLKLGRIIQSRQEGQFDYSHAGYVDQVMGAAFLIRDTVVRDVGLLDVGFFTLFEEVDYAKRARDAGWRCFYTPASTIRHVRAASFNQLVGFRRSLPWLQSSLHYARKHLTPWQVAVLYILVPLSLALVLPASVKHIIVKYAR